VSVGGNRNRRRIVVPVASVERREHEPFIELRLREDGGCNECNRE
jgi:hypothetical protein